MLKNLEKAKETIGLYCGLMEELKTRQNVVLTILEKKISLPVRVAHELCYLQLRIICELIAIACLVAHGDIAQIRKLRTEWDADKIIKALERLHSEFYPKPGQQVKDDHGHVVEVEDITSGFLTKAELLKLYGTCGAIVHRGTLNDVILKAPKIPDFTKIQEWITKIVTLLNHHQIQLVIPNLQIWVVMQAEDGRVHGALMQEAAAAS